MHMPQHFLGLSGPSRVESEDFAAIVRRGDLFPQLQGR